MILPPRAWKGVDRANSRSWLFNYMTKLIDKFGRRIDYLRISVTDRCNLRCVYCMPASGIVHKRQSQILSFEDIYRIAAVAAKLGIRKVRITGGEPLVRKDLPLLIENLKNIDGIKEVGLTTNGILLGEYAHLLKKSGLDSMNISLDSLIPEKFQNITRGGNLKAVLDGIEKALSAGFSSVKVNAVLIKGFNICEVPNFALLAKDKPIHVRFIECMPTTLSGFGEGDLFFSAIEANDILTSLGRMKRVDSGEPCTARVFRVDGFCGTVGFISPISEPFCSSCNKLRLTSDGRLKSCLASSKQVDLKSTIDESASDEDLAALFKKAVEMKPPSHNLSDEPLGIESENFSMCQIGG